LIRWHSTATEGGHVATRVTMAIISPLERDDMFFRSWEDAGNDTEVVIGDNEQTLSRHDVGASVYAAWNPFCCPWKKALKTASGHVIDVRRAN